MTFKGQWFKVTFIASQFKQEDTICKQMYRYDQEKQGLSNKYRLILGNGKTDTRKWEDSMRIKNVRLHKALNLHKNNACKYTYQYIDWNLKSRLL